MLLKMLGLKAEYFAEPSQETCPVLKSFSNHPVRRPVCVVLLGSHCKMLSCGAAGLMGQ